MKIEKLGTAGKYLLAVLAGAFLLTHGGMRGVTWAESDEVTVEHALSLHGWEVRRNRP